MKNIKKADKKNTNPGYRQLAGKKKKIVPTFRLCLHAGIQKTVLKVTNDK